MDYKRGSEWRQWDLHIHTPSSFEWKGTKYTGDPKNDNEILARICKQIKDSRVAVYGIMDYWTFDGFIKLRKYIQATPGAIGDKVILPGIELRVQAPTNCRMNMHLLLSEETTDQELTELQNKLKLESIDRSPSEESLIQLGAQSGKDVIELHGFKEDDIADNSKMLELGSKIAEIKSDSFKEAASFLPKEKCIIIGPWDTYSGVREIDWREHPITSYHWLDTIDMFEVKNFKTAKGFLGIKDDDNRGYFDNFRAAIKHNKGVFRGSDAHKINDYGNFPGDNKCWMKANPSFKGLRQVLAAPENRCFIGELPNKLKQIEKSPNKFIRHFKVSKNSNDNDSKDWFDVDIPINPGLVAVIGNKGSGKSAFADILSYTCDSNISESEYSFLNEKRFRESNGKIAKKFKASVAFANNKLIEKKSLDSKTESYIEFVKYLPQKFIENICNDISSDKKGTFDQEIRNVIFSHIPHEEKLNATSFDTYIDIQSKIITNAIDAKKNELKKEIEKISDQTNRMEPSYLKQLKAKLEQKELALKEWTLNLPEEVTQDNLNDEQQRTQQRFISIYRRAQDKFESSLENINKENQRLKVAEVTFKNIVQSIKLIQKRSEEEIAQCNNELDKVKYEFKIEPLKNEELNNIIKSIMDQLELIRGQIKTLNNQLKGLSKKITFCETRIIVLKNNFKHEQLQYQRYQDELKEWTLTQKKMIGDKDKEGSIKYLEAEILAIKNAPCEFKKNVESVFRISKEIISEHFKNLDLYTNAYSYAQAHINEQRLLIDKLKFSFESKIILNDFKINFLKNINKGVRGNFYGKTESEKRLEKIISEATLSTEDGVYQFLESIWSSLIKQNNEAEAEAEPNPNTILNQLKSNVRIIDFLTYIFELDYIIPKFALKLDGDDISKLSPGQKGLLLLIFYLAIDKTDIPIVIDQPEENLDNQTIWDTLVPYINKAKQRRQVIIVTHNPNLAVVCDADQVVISSCNKKESIEINYEYGALEDVKINNGVVEILEGTMPAFRKRGEKYF